MKKIITLSFLVVTFITQAQIGIGTTNPQADLHIAGDLLVQDTFQLATFGTVRPTDENFK